MTGNSNNDRDTAALEREPSSNTVHNNHYVHMDHLSCMFNGAMLCCNTEAVTNEAAATVQISYITNSCLPFVHHMEGGDSFVLLSNPTAHGNSVM